MSSARLQDTKSASKNQAYFYILAMNNSKLKKKMIPFVIASGRIKYLEIQKHGKTFTLKTKTILKEIQDLLTWKDILCSRIKRLNMVKVLILPKLIY